MAFVMRLMSCGNVLSLFLPRSNEKEVAAASLFLNVLSLSESSINPGVDANGPCFPPVTVQKALSMSTSTLEQSRCHDGDFPHTPCGIWGESRRGRPMAGYGQHLAASADALLKKQRLRGLDATRRTEGEVAARWTARVFLWEYGHRRQCA